MKRLLPLLLLLLLLVSCSRKTPVPTEIPQETETQESVTQTEEIEEIEEIVETPQVEELPAQTLLSLQGILVSEPSINEDTTVFLVYYRSKDEMVRVEADNALVYGEKEKTRDNALLWIKEELL